MPTTYSIADSAIVCKTCVDNALCPGGNQINVSAGYWRANMSTDNINICFVKGACPGGLENNSCTIGYKGILCHECIGL
jgi:hypothetical protein